MTLIQEFSPGCKPELVDEVLAEREIGTPTSKGQRASEIRHDIGTDAPGRGRRSHSRTVLEFRYPD